MLISNIKIYSISAKTIFRFDWLVYNLNMIEIGKKYGRLTVIEKLNRKEFTTSVYLCRCDCGNMKEVNINKLHTGHTKSCGCLNHKIRVLTGMRFGRLVVDSFKERKDNKTLWNCTCDCGNKCVVSSRDLLLGSTVSCGCKNKENQSNFMITDLVDGTRLCQIKADRKVNKNNAAGVTGVHFDKEQGMWVAQITFQRVNHHLGRFKTKEEAIDARKKAEVEYFGKYRSHDE